MTGLRCWSQGLWSIQTLTPGFSPIFQHPRKLYFSIKWKKLNHCLYIFKDRSNLYFIACPWEITNKKKQLFFIHFFFLKGIVCTCVKAYSWKEVEKHFCIFCKSLWTTNKLVTLDFTRRQVLQSQQHKSVLIKTNHVTIITPALLVL